MIKNLLQSLIRCFLVSIILILIFGLIMYLGNWQDKTVGVMVVIIYFLSNLIGGISVGKSAKKNKYMWGILVGFLFFIVIFLVSIIGNNGFVFNTSTLIALFVSIVGGMTGGMIS